MKAKGFVVKPGVVANAAKLRLEIRSLDYDVEVGFWSGGVNITTSMKARANGLTEEYEKFYRAASEDRAVFYPDAKKKSESITAVVDNMLRQFFEDGKLLNVLAADKPMAAMPPLGR
ncbi:MAG: YajG family lipoprotein [Pseudomonadota bacterium]